MKIGIMQPYFVPYIGYWQLMNAVDKYVIYDDVNYINRGWINRNRILNNDQPKYFNIPMLGASQNKLINEIHVNIDRKLMEKNLRIIESAYKKAPYYGDVYPLIEKIIKCDNDNLAGYIIHSFYIINDYLDITTELILSSNLKKNNELKGEEKILSICELLGADEYYNAIGGQKLYCYKDFEQRGIKLKFLQTNDIEYRQFGSIFEKNLSIIDVMMFNSCEKIKEYLNMFILISA